MTQTTFDFAGPAEAPRLAPVDELRQAVFAFIVSRGYDGATDGQICAVFGPYRGEMLRAIRCELLTLGHVRNSGRMRSTRSHRADVVWISTGKPLTEASR